MKVKRKSMEFFKRIVVCVVLFTMLFGGCSRVMALDDDYGNGGYHFSTSEIETMVEYINNNVFKSKNELNMRLGSMDDNTRSAAFEELKKIIKEAPLQIVRIKDKNDKNEIIGAIRILSEINGPNVGGYNWNQFKESFVSTDDLDLYGTIIAELQTGGNIKLEDFKTSKKEIMDFFNENIALKNPSEETLLEMDDMFRQYFLKYGYQMVDIEFHDACESVDAKIKEGMKNNSWKHTNYITAFDAFLKAKEAEPKVEGDIGKLEEKLEIDIDGDNLKPAKTLLGKLADFIGNLFIELGAWIADLLLQAVTWFMYGGGFYDYNMVVKTSDPEWSIISAAPTDTAGIVEGSVPEEMRKGHKYPYVRYSPEEIFAGKEPSGRRIAILDINFLRRVETTKDANGNEVVKEGEYIGQVNGWLKIKNTVATWYQAMRLLAIVGLLSVLIYTGIRMMLNSGNKNNAKYKQMMVDWVMALVILFSMHYIMAFTLTVIENVTTLFTNDSTGTNSIKIVEEEGNTFYTNLIGLVRYGIQQDGLGIQAVYLLLYAFMIYATFKFTFVYIQRTVKIVFLTLIGPLVAFTYPIDKMSDGSAQGFNMWLKEYVFNALIQPVHFLMYKVLITSAISLASNNLLYAIAALLFMTEAENIFKQIFGFNRGGGKAPGLSTAGAMAAGAAASQLMNRYDNIGNKVDSKNIRRQGLDDLDAPSPVNADALDAGAFDGVDDEDDEDREETEGGAGRRRTSDDDEEEPEEPETPLRPFEKPEDDPDIIPDDDDPSQKDEDEPPIGSERENGERKNPFSEFPSEPKDSGFFDYSDFKQSSNSTSTSRRTQSRNNGGEFGIKNFYGTGRRTHSESTDTSGGFFSRVKRKAGRGARRVARAVLPERLKTTEEIMRNAGIKLDKQGGGVKSVVKKIGKKATRKLGNKLGIDRSRGKGYNIGRLAAKTAAKGTRLLVQAGVGALVATTVFGASLVDGKANPFESLALGMLAARATGKIGRKGEQLVGSAILGLRDLNREAVYGVKNANMMKYIEAARNDEKLHQKFVRKYGIDKADEMKERYLQEYVPRGITDFNEFTKAVKYADKLSEDQIKADTVKLERMELDKLNERWLKTETTQNGTTLTNEQRVDNLINEEKSRGRELSRESAIERLKNEDYVKEHELEEGWETSDDIVRFKQQRIAETDRIIDKGMKQFEKDTSRELDRTYSYDSDFEKYQQQERAKLEQMYQIAQEADTITDYRDPRLTKEQKMALNYLGNDNTDPRWKEALKPDWLRKEENAKRREIEKRKNQEIMKVTTNTQLSEDQKKAELAKIKTNYDKAHIEAEVSKHIEDNKDELLRRELKKQYEQKRKEEIRAKLENATGGKVDDKIVETTFKQEQQEKKTEALEKAIKEQRRKLEQTRDANLKIEARNRQIEKQRKMEEMQSVRTTVDAQKKRAADTIRAATGNQKLTDTEAFKLAHRETSDQISASASALYQIVKEENPRALYNKEVREAYIRDKLEVYTDPAERERQRRYYEIGFKQIAKQKNTQNFG